MKIVALAYNFGSLGNESIKHPFFFFKNPNSIIADGETIRIPKRSHVWPEVELALRIGSDEIFDAIAIANDVTIENVENRDVHLAFSKGLDTFLPMGEWVEDFDLGHIIRNCNMYSSVNDTRVQTGHLNGMLWKPMEAIEYISKYLAFYPGDILLTGTCFHKHYPLRDGDKVFMDIEGGGLRVGSLSNPVVEI